MNMPTRREAVAAVGAAAITLIANESASAQPKAATITHIVPAINTKAKMGSKHYTFAIKGTNLNKDTTVTATGMVGSVTHNWVIDVKTVHTDGEILLLRMKKEEKEEKDKDSKPDDIRQIQEITVTVTNGKTTSDSMTAKMVVYEE